MEAAVEAAAQEAEEAAEAELATVGAAPRPRRPSNARRRGGARRGAA